jgi:hypothetical protein
MPVTARLSQRFYERFGDDLTNELVDWFNSVDTTYRSDLRDLNEANFARFDAKLEQRIAGVESRIGQRIAESESRMIRWMVTLWTGSILSTLGVIVALVLRR